MADFRDPVVAKPQLPDEGEGQADVRNIGGRVTHAPTFPPATALSKAARTHRMRLRLVNPNGWLCNKTVQGV